MHSTDKQATYSVALMNRYLVGVFRYMTLGLFITGIVAYGISLSTTLVQALFSNILLLILLFIAEIGIVYYVSANIAKLSANTATGLFLTYSALNGLTLSAIFLLYTKASIVTTFFIAGAMFLTMAIYGSITKRDLTSLGSFLTMGLFGIIIATLVNIFLRSPVVDSVITYIGVFIFLGLTAFDVQKLKYFGESMPLDNPTVAQRGIILGALTLYLDFINLFLFLLRIFGNSREN